MLLLLISGTAITAPCATPSAGSTRGTNGKDPYADVFELLLFGNTWTRAPAPARSSFYGLTVANLCSMLVVLTQSGRWRNKNINVRELRFDSWNSRSERSIHCTLTARLRREELYSLTSLLKEKRSNNRQFYPERRRHQSSTLAYMHGFIALRLGLVSPAHFLFGLSSHNAHTGDGF
jgi:hypothetical protein